MSGGSDGKCSDSASRRCDRIGVDRGFKFFADERQRIRSQPCATYALPVTKARRRSASIAPRPV